VDRHSDTYEDGNAHANRDVDADAHADQYVHTHANLDANGDCYEYSSSPNCYQETPAAEADEHSDTLALLCFWADSERTGWGAA
jgi:hypothetical protein